MSARWVAVGAVSALLAVAFGAFGAHALSGKLSERSLAIYHTGAQYHLMHALALVCVGLWARSAPSTLAEVSGWSFAIGTLLFSGSLYALALTDIRILGAITPLGGLSFMAGWATFAWAAIRG